MSTLWQDLRCAVRQLKKESGITAIGVITWRWELARQSRSHGGAEIRIRKV
jgi:hypothetical protein